MGKRKQKEEKCLRARLGCPEGNDPGGAVECGDQPGGTDIDQQADQFRDDRCAEDTEYSAPFCAVVLLCTQVLADEGGESQGKAGDRQEHKPLDL